MRKIGKLEVLHVVFNAPETKVFWNDGGTTVVTAMSTDEFSEERGVLQAWFEKTNGLSKTKSNKLLTYIVELGKREPKKPLTPT